LPESHLHFFKRLSTDELIRIAGDPASLNPDVIHLLQRELIARNHSEEALALTEFLLNGPRRFSFMSIEELQKVVFERLESGESIESIRKLGALLLFYTPDLP